MNNFRICDTHNDFLTELDCNEIQQYLNYCEKQNVYSICSSYWTTKKKKKEIKSELYLKSEFLEKINRNYLLHIEDLWWVQNEKDLQFLLKLKPFSCSLTWNEENSLAGGTNSSKGLTQWGKYVLLNLLKEGVVVDVAHLNRKSFWQVTKYIENNIYCSHTGFNSLKKNLRNLTDKQIERIIQSNGFVGLFFFDKCIKVGEKERFNIEDIIKNLNFFASRWGYDCLGIGSDFYGIDVYPKELENYDKFGELSEGLKEEGWAEEQINKIFYNNFFSKYLNKGE